MATEPVYVADLDRCEPAEALVDVPRWRTWRRLSYQTDRFAGVMLLAGEETAAPEVTYPLEVRGWHRLYVGVFLENGSHAVKVGVRLSGDRATSVLHRRAGASDRMARVEELYWKEADLTGQRIAISHVAARVGEAEEPASYKCYDARIAYVKLVPLSDAEVAALRAERASAGGRRLYGHNDAHGYLWLYSGTTEEEVRRELEPYRHTDFSRMYWECGGGDVMYHLGRAGRLPTCDTQSDWTYVGDRLHAEGWRRYRETGLDPFKVALDYCRELGLEFHASYRTGGFYFPAPFDQWNVGGMYGKHPELRAVDREGRVHRRLSYSFPETRQFAISFLKDVARYPIDGVCLLYNRRPPMVEYEPPLVEGFTREYGEDPRRLREDDPRWLTYRCGALTQFHREIRAAMDEVAREQGRGRIAVSAIVGNRAENLVNGMDPAAWIAEGTIDTLIPYSSAPRMDSSAEAWLDMEEVRYFVSLVQGSSCRLAMNIMPRINTPEHHRRKAAALYEQGVENFFFWDSAGPSGRADFSSGWNALRRLGHREEIEAWRAGGEPSLANETRPIHVLGEWDMRYITPG